MKKAGLVLVVISLLIAVGSPVYAGDSAFALATEYDVISWNMGNIRTIGGEFCCHFSQGTRE